MSDRQKLVGIKVADKGKFSFSFSCAGRALAQRPVTLSPFGNKVFFFSCSPDRHSRCKLGRSIGLDRRR